MEYKFIVQMFITQSFFVAAPLIVIPACSGGIGASYGPIIVCFGPAPISLPSCAHTHLGPEAQ